MNSNHTILETKNLYKSYYLGTQEVPVLKDVCFTMPRGEFLAIMGPSGSGKSTLLNILGCLDTPTSGEYLLDGNSVGSLSDQDLAMVRNRQIGFVFQNFNLLPKLDVYSNVELPLIYGNVSKSQRGRLVQDSLSRLGLWDRRHHRPNEISGGQKQRAAIARALVKRPSIILADEPTGNLDSATTREMLDLLQSLHKDGNTILAITHERDVAERTQRILHLKDGKLNGE